MTQSNNTAIGAVDDSLLLCASDLQHSAIYDNHVEMQACIRAVANRIAALASAAAPAEQPGEIQNLRKALQFYADKDHFNISDEGAWDTVSGEPQNYWCDEEGTATVEDGTIARLALAGHQIKFDADAAPQPSPTPQADSQPAATVGTIAHVGTGKTTLARAIASALRAAPVEQPDTAYAALPDTYYLAGGEVKTWDENHMRAFADATCALRAYRGQALRLLTQAERDSLGRRAEGMDGNEWDQWVQEKFAQVNGLRVQGGSYEWD